MQYLLNSPYSKAILAGLTDSSIIAVTDKNGIILEVNETFCAHSGYAAEELIGKTHQMLRSGVHDASFMRNLWHAILAGEIWRGEICNRRKNGTLYWLKTTIYPLLSATGSIEAFLAIRIDITALKESEQRLQTLRTSYARLVENAPDIIARFDRNLRHIYINPVIKRITGLSPEDYLGKTNEELAMPEELVKLWNAHLKMVLETGDERYMEFAFTAPDGPRFFQARIVPEKNIEGRVDTMLCITRDVTVQHEMQNAVLRRDARLQGIIDSLPGMVGYWDKDLRNQFSNKAYLEWFGKLPHEIAGMTMRELLGNELFEKNREYAERALSGEYQVFDREIPRPDGTTGWTQAFYVPDIQGENVVGFFVFVFDISAIKEAQVAAQHANEAKNRFLSNISHELRTPLNGILGFAQLAAMSAANEQEVLEYAGHIRIAAEHLLLLINELIDFSRIEAGQFSMDLKLENLENVLRSVVALVHVQARERGIRLVTEYSIAPALSLVTDARRLRQVLLNLLSNAIKFTREGRVLLRVYEDLDAVRFEVQDEGIGIAESDMPRLFTPFSQVGDTSYRSQGLGLGLAISQQIIGALGGTISAASQLGKGSVFSFALPVRTDVPGGTAQRPAEAHRPWRTDIKVLYVEDDAQGRQLMSEILQRSGMTVTTVHDAASALETAAQMRPDLILLDLNLPDISGFELFERIRSTDWGHSVPVIAVSADFMTVTRERAQAMGIAEFVPKPVDFNHLLSVLSRFAASN